MNMHFKAAAWLSVMGFLCSVQAASVTREDATTAAQAWVREGNLFGVPMGMFAETAVEHATTNGTLFYTVKMTGGGTVFTTSDTTQEPIVGFTAATNDFSSIDTQSPLWALLNHDISALGEESTTSKPVVSLAFASAQQADESHQAKWSRLLNADQPVYRGLSFATAITDVSGIGDLRVPALVKTQWSQSVAQSKACYNYYTPNGLDPSKFKEGSTKNAVCGCVATAISQIMRYFEYPKGNVSPVTHNCQWSDSGKDGTYSTLTLTMQGGSYDWDKMTLKPADDELTDENCKAIGKLTSDVGIGVWMQYSPSGSGAYTPEGGTVMRDVFGYKNAVCFSDDQGLLKANSLQRQSALARSMFANFDAGLPVLVAIPGHAVLADGYGYNNNVDYVHFNMGWAGQCDYWYNIPDLTKAGSVYTAVNDITYNIFTNAPSTSAVMSGRVVDGDGKPVSGVHVHVRKAGNAEDVADVVTSARGVWGAIVPKGTYDIATASENGRAIASLENIAVSNPTSKDTMWVNCKVNALSPADPSALGNSWGNDMVLSEPAVRTIVAGDTNVYDRLDKALLAVSEENTRVEILLPCELRESVTLTNSVTLVATNAVPADALVTRVADAAIAVTNDATLTLAHVAFTGSTAPFVDVAAGSVVAVGDEVDFGMDSAKPAISTADTKGFCLNGAVTNGVCIASAGAPNKDDPFGTYACSAEVATKSAPFLVNAYDEYGELRGKVQDGKLVWGRVDVPLADAAGYYVDKANKTNTFARVDRVFYWFEDARAKGELGDKAEIVLRKSGTLLQLLVIDRDTRLRGENGAALTQVDREAGFVVTNGTLDVSGLSISNYTGDAVFCNPLFLVNGGDLALQDLTVAKIQSRGAVRVQLGGARISRVVFEDCKADTSGSSTGGGDGRGGAIYVGGAGCRLALADTTITNCQASAYGGGVFAANGSELSLSGAMRIVGNTKVSSSDHRADNLCVGGTNVVLHVPASLQGEQCVDLFNLNGAGNKDGYVFATLGSGISGPEADRTADCFYREGNTNLVAKSTGTGLMWALKSKGPQPVDWNLAAVYVVYGTQTNGYANITDAFASLTNGSDAVVAVRTNQYFRERLTVANKVTLTTASNAVTMPCTVARAGDCDIYVGAGTKLTVEDLVLRGMFDETLGGSGSLVRVEGGELVLGDGVVITDVNGSGARVANAVTVWDKGVLRMSGDATVRNCRNDYYVDDNEPDYSHGGGVSVENAYADLRGGYITNCSAHVGGGLFVGSDAQVEISGAMHIVGNAKDATFTTNDNVYVSDNSLPLSLAAPLMADAALGVTSGVKANTNIFAKAGSYAEWDKTALTNSAACFVNDITGGHGVAVTNASADVFLAWSTLFANGMAYTNVANGVTNVYYAVGLEKTSGGESKLLPLGFTAVDVDAAAQTVTLTFTNTVRGYSYSIYATNVLSNGFSIDSGVKPLTNFQAEADGPCTCTLPLVSGPCYWKVLGTPASAK